jgi:hypothetical protein
MQKPGAHPLRTAGLTSATPRVITAGTLLADQSVRHWAVVDGMRDDVLAKYSRAHLPAPAPHAGARRGLRLLTKS